jgi:hypothetical protein
VAEGAFPSTPLHLGSPGRPATVPWPLQSLVHASAWCAICGILKGSLGRWPTPRLAFVRRVGAWGSTATGDAIVPPSPAWPLYYDGDRRTRFAYAIFALNKVGLRRCRLDYQNGMSCSLSCLQQRRSEVSDA